MLLENFLISNVIFARQPIFSTLYVVKSSGKQDHFTCVFILYGLSCKNIWIFFLKNVPRIARGNLLEIG